jgi:hypothetical protein
LFAIRDEINADDDDEPQRVLDWPCEQNIPAPIASSVENGIFGG